MGQHFNVGEVIYLQRQNMEVYGCSVRKIRFFGQKKGLKPAHQPPVKSFQHRQVHICLILTNFGMKSLLDTLRGD